MTLFSTRCHTLIKFGTVLLALTIGLGSSLVYRTLGAAQATPTILVTGGQIRGALLDSAGAVFKGIPYAQPPVGDLRWREPMPVKPWTEIRDTTRFGAICAQTSANGSESSQEDCLYLNVWTPEWPIVSRKPVMVWLTGGGNFGGGTSATGIGAAEDAERLARRGVVVVTLNYRLGVFGFFAHPQLTSESPNRASGNQGLLDQIAALKWVQTNISRFGGDAANVTLFGQSAGALDANVLMTSPLAKGLFHRVIGQSGAIAKGGDDRGVDQRLREPLTLSQAEQLGERLVTQLKLSSAASLKDLRGVSKEDLFAAAPNALQPLIGYSGIIVDGYVLPTAPASIFAKGQQHAVPLLLGSNARERIPRTTNPADLSKAIEDAYGPVAGRAQTLYVGDPDPLYGTTGDQWLTDTSFRCPAVAELAWHAAAGNPAFEYEFARVAPGREPQGVIHGAEVPYVFGTVLLPGVFQGRVQPRPNEIDQQLSELMQQYWINFSKTSDPNGERLPRWPKFDVRSRAYVQFTDADPVAKEGLRRPFCDLFIERVNGLVAR